MLTREQLELRRRGIGASEISSIMGLNPYQTALDVYLSKINPIPDVDPLANNDAVIFGNLFEGPIISHYESITGEKINRCSTLTHPQFEFILATPDGLVVGKPKGIEVKTTGEFARRKWINDQIPYSFLLQAQQNIIVTGFNSWDLIVLTGGNKLEIFEIKHDPELEKIIINEASKFWLEHVKKQIPPAADYQAPNVLDAMKRLYSDVEEGATIELSEDIDSIIADWLRAKENIKAFSAVEKVSQAKILEKLGHNAIGRLSNGAVVVRKKIKRKGYVVEDSEYVTLTYKDLKNEQ